MAVFGVALAVCTIALAPLALTQSVTLRSSYPVANNYSFVELKCLDSIYQTPERGASFQRNGTTIVEDVADGTTFITLTQETEGFFTCSLAGSVSNKIGLAAQPTSYSNIRITSEVEVPVLGSTVTTELTCDIQPGALQERYTVYWVYFPSGTTSGFIAGDNFDLTVNVGYLFDKTYQCRVTVDHNGQGVERVYRGRYINIVATTPTTSNPTLGDFERLSSTASEDTEGGGQSAAETAGEVIGAIFGAILLCCCFILPLICACILCGG